MFNSDFLLKYTFLGNSLQQYLYAIGIIILFSIVGHFLKNFVSKRIKNFAANTKTKIDDIAVDVWEKIASFVIFVVGLYVGLEYLSFDNSVDAYINGVLLVVVAVKVTIVIQFIFDSILELYLRPLAHKSKILDAQFVIFFRKLGDVAIWILSIVFIIANLGVNVASLITGLGIGGLALALGAQETISNIFASLSLLADRPFDTNDWVIINGQQGKIKELGLRSIRMSSFDGTEIIIPTKQLQLSTIENVDRRKQIRVNETISLANGSKHQNLTKFMKAVGDYLETEATEVVRFRVNFHSYEDNSLNVLLTYWVQDNKDWEQFLTVKSTVNLKVKELMEKYNLSLVSHPTIHGPKIT